MVAPTSGPRRPVLIAGDIRARGAVVPIFEGIVRAAWSGELAIDDPLVHRTIVLDRGAIVGARTSAAEERIGAIARKLGMLSAEQITTILDRHGERRFGEVAVELGMVTRERVLEAIVQQAEDIVAGASTVAFGTFSFTDGFDSDDIGAWALDALEVLARVRGEGPPSARADALPRFNEAIAAIFRAATSHGSVPTLRTAMASYASGNVVDRALFSSPRMYGTLDAEDVEAALGATPEERREEVLRMRLHDALQYALFVVCAELPREAERSLLARVEPTLAALSIGRKSASSMPIARVLVVRRTSEPRSAAAERQEPGRLELVPAGRLATEPLPLVRVPERAEAPPVLVEEEEPAPRAIVARRRRASVPLVLPLVLVAVALLGGGALVALRTTNRAPSAPSATPTASAKPSVVTLPSETLPVPLPPPAASPEPSSTAPAPAPTGTTGIIRTADPGHQVWIDGRMVGDTPQSFIVPCGLHVVRIGVGGQPQMTEVPCGGEVALGFQ